MGTSVCRVAVWAGRAVLAAGWAWAGISKFLGPERQQPPSGRGLD